MSELSETANGSTGENPLASLSDVDLWNAHLMMEIACGRNHSALSNPRRQYFCLVARNLKIEAQNRGNDFPIPPFGVGQLRKDNALKS